MVDETKVDEIAVDEPGPHRLLAYRNMFGHFYRPCKSRLREHKTGCLLATGSPTRGGPAQPQWAEWERK